MSNNDTADKLRAKVEDWQSYLGKSESPWGAVSQPETPSAPPSPAAAPPSGPESAYPPPARPVAVVELESEPVIDVHPPEAVENEAPVHTVVEVLPPEPATRPYDMGPGKKRNGRRPLDEAELKGVLFSDPRKVESEFQHVRRANAVLSIFLIVMVVILCSVMVWHLVD